MDIKSKKSSQQSIIETTTTPISQGPKYQCIDCKYIVSADDIKNDIKCKNCKGRILTKIRTEGEGIEYLAR